RKQAARRKQLPGLPAHIYSNILTFLAPFTNISYIGNKLFTTRNKSNTHCGVVKQGIVLAPAGKQ
ncbi:MAG: hypothetical protein JSV61_09560, partial [Anaerolineales bacterium]